MSSPLSVSAAAAFHALHTSGVSLPVEVEEGGWCSGLEGEDEIVRGCVGDDAHAAEHVRQLIMCVLNQFVPTSTFEELKCGMHGSGLSAH